MRKGQTLPPKQRLRIEVSKETLQGLQGASIGAKAAEGLAKRAPDLFLLGGGFFLGYVMNMRPGITLPGGLFIGFPDFGGRIDELQKALDICEAEVEKEAANLSANDEEEARCVELANKAFLGTEERPGHRDTFRLAADTKRCQERNISKSLLEKCAKLRGDLGRHKLAQGLLMATLIFAFTRPGFLQGIGEIIPG